MGDGVEAAAAMNADVTQGAPAGAVAIVVPWRPMSPNRWAEHWGARQRRHAAAHKAFRAASAGLVAPALPVVVTLTRVSRGKLDQDNLVASLKPVIDAVANFLHCDDRDSRIEWAYRQGHTKEKVRSPFHYGPRELFACYVRIEIRPAGA